MKLIDSDALMVALGYVRVNGPTQFLQEEHDECTQALSNCWKRLLYIIADQPAVDAEPVKHGRWINEDDGYWRCSRCGTLFSFDDHGDMHPTEDYGCNFCPQCGAKMDEED